MFIVEYQKLDPDISDPIRINQTDAGIDLRAYGDYTIPPQERTMVRTGIIVKIPDGYYGRIAPRSGLALKSGIDVLAGVVDSGYRGEIRLVLYNSDKHNTFYINNNDRVAQIIIEKYYDMAFIEVKSIDESSRGKNGFGSSGVL